MTRIEAHVHIAKKRAGDPFCLSIRTLPNGRVSYTDEVGVRNATFAVQPAGLRRFRETGQKNVHAYLRGTIDPYMSRDYAWREVIYNPNHHHAFIDKERGYAVYQADYACFVNGRLYYYDEV